MAAHQSSQSTSESAVIVAFGAGLGLIGSILVYPHQIALGFTLYVLLLLCGLFICARLQKVRAVRRNLPLVIVVIFFAAMLAVRSDPSLLTLNLAGGTFAALLLVYFFANGSIAQQDLIQYVVTAMTSAVAVWLQPFDRLLQTISWLATRRGKWGSAMPFVRGVVITVPIVGVFIWLLSSADTVFGDLVSRILQFFSFRNAQTLVGQTFVGTMLAWTAIGGLSFALLDRKTKRAPKPSAKPIMADVSDEEKAAPQTTIPFLHLGFTESVMLLGSVCIVFSSFVVIQFVYLFGGQGNITLQKFNYADYVHRGFAELNMVSVLTLGLAYVLNAIAIRRDRRQVNLLRALLTILVILTGVILVSAFQRMRLYDEVYGLTSLRLVIMTFIVWLGILFVGFAVSLYWQPASINVFGLVTLTAVFGFAITLNVINPDAFVARQMIDRNDVDPMYLVSLSNEAVPYMVTLVDAPQPGLRNMVRQELAYRLAQLRNRGDWRDFNVTDSGAVSVLESIKVKLQVVPTTLTPDDFAVVQRGMKYREVVRQLGAPLTRSYPSGRGFLNEADMLTSDMLSLTYQLGDGRIVSIKIDTAQGVMQTCIIENSGCTNILK